MNINTESLNQHHQKAVDVQIPLERIDFTTVPVDPRVHHTDYCYVSPDEDSFPWTLPLPRFWREIQQNLNHERKMQGMPQHPTSSIRGRVLNDIQRMTAKPNPSADPRLSAKHKQPLFIEPPRKVQPPLKLHNQLVPFLQTSVFDEPDAQDQSSNLLSSFSLLLEKSPPVDGMEDDVVSSSLSDPDDSNDDDFVTVEEKLPDSHLHNGMEMSSLYILCKKLL